MAQPSMADTTQPPPPPTLTNPRFTLELEFVLSLANPHYLSHLAITYPNLLGTTTLSSASTTNNDDTNTSAAEAAASSEAQAFVAYLAYLYSYWKTPEYAQFLTHPGATLRALRLLQEETFRKDVIRPQVIEGLLGVGVAVDTEAVTGTRAATIGEAEAEGGQGAKTEG